MHVPWRFVDDKAVQARPAIVPSLATLLAHPKIEAFFFQQPSMNSSELSAILSRPQTRQLEVYCLCQGSVRLSKVTGAPNPNVVSVKLGLQPSDTAREPAPFFALCPGLRFFRMHACGADAEALKKAAPPGCRVSTADTQQWRRTCLPVE